MASPMDKTETPSPGKSVQRLSDNAYVPIEEVWSSSKVTVLVLCRHLGCFCAYELASLLQQTVRPQLEAAGVRIFFVTCGNMRFINGWQEATQWPAELTYIDQEGVLYQKLQTRNSFWRTFFDPRMWFLGLFKRMRQKDAWRAFILACKKYKLAVPERGWQSYQQGGTVVIQESKVLWSHRDRSPGDYPDWAEVIKAATEAAAKSPAVAAAPSPGPEPPGAAVPQVPPAPAAGTA